MAYGPQSVSLTQAGGDLDLLEALRGSRARAKTQQEMLREQSMSPVEIGSYNGIQGKFPISQGINKIAQGLLATYMDYQARDRAQAAADAQKDEAQKFAAGFAGTPPVAGVDAVLPERGTVAGPVVDGVDPETPEAANFRIAMDKLRREQPGQAGDDYRAQAPVFGMPGQRMEAAPGQGAPDDPGVVGRDAVAAQAGTGPTPAQRTAMLMQGYASTNPTVNRMATYLGDQDAKAEIARQHNEMMGSNAAVLAQSRGAAIQQRVEEGVKKAELAQRSQAERAYTHHAPKAMKDEAAYTSAISALDNFEAKGKALLTHSSLDAIAGPIAGRTPTVLPQSLDAKAKLDQFMNAAVFSEMQKLKDSGASLGTFSNADANRMQAAASAINLNTSPESVRAAIKDVIDLAAKARGLIADAQGHAQKYTQSLYDRTKDPSAPLYVVSKNSEPKDPEPKPKPAPADGAKGTQGDPISVKTIDEAKKLAPGTWITRPDGTLGQVPPR